MTKWYKLSQEQEKESIKEKTMILMRGISGSGKSFLAKQLSDDGLILSTDDFFMQNGQYNFDPTLIQDAHVWNQGRANQALQQNISPIVIDNTNVQAWEMKPYVENALKYGYKIEFAEPNTSWKFDAKALEKRNSHNVPIDVIEDMISKWDHDVNVDAVLQSENPNDQNDQNNQKDQNLAFNLAKYTTAIALDKKAALEPGAWETEESPARLLKDQPSSKTPYGTIINQPQDASKLKEDYSGVHLSPSKELAVLYANGKATPNDPPVIIEIDPIELKKETDVDAQLNSSLDIYVNDKRNEWQNILSSNENSSEIVDNIMMDLDQEDMIEDSYEIYNASDYITNDVKRLPPLAIYNYLADKDDSEVVRTIQDMIQGNIPSAVYIEVVQQFRVMHPIVSDRIKAIYRVPWVDFSMHPNEIQNLRTLSEEELEETEYVLKDDKLYNEDGQILLDFEDFEFGWLDMQPLYMNQQLTFKGMSSNESSWHGTSLNRAKQAFPELL